MSNIIGKRNKQEKAAVALGLDRGSVFDSLNRADFPDDESFLDAAVRLELERNTPEYREVRRRLRAEYAERQEEEIRAAQTQRLAEIRGAVQLDALDVQHIDEEAARLAEKDLSEKKITASQLGPRIAKYAQELTEKRKDEKASAAMFNEMLRGAAGSRSLM